MKIICKGCCNEFKIKMPKYCSNICRKQLKFWEHSNNFKWITATEEQKFKKLRQTFEKKVIKKDGCWDWNGKLHKSGYAPMNGINNKQTYAHTASWLIHNGTIPDNLYVLHKCDNRSCSNPDHLFLGTSKDNTVDMIKKGRNNPIKGENCSWSKLTNNDVMQIKQMFTKGINCKLISEKFNVKLSTILDIKYNKTWKHIKE